MSKKARGEGRARDDAHNPSDFALQSYGRAVNYLSRSYQSYLDTVTAPYGVSSAHVPLLVYLWEGNSGETQNEIARALGVDKGTISRNVQALLRLGLVTQTECTRDSRACTVDLTDEGRRLSQPIGKMSDDWAAGVTGHLSEEDRVRVLADLQSMIVRSDALIQGAKAAHAGMAAASFVDASVPDITAQAVETV